ncbi:PepSY domain-containing protein [Chitinophaga sp. HK235]|uniref:PepSY domain-containing protein n=1 Tax=Chitinophaga sp. HK235 TaxID=2952571 RepID=UPI001BABAC20|nr:PepSY domain-containing protein [Chitinophaga sp. HK235]
MFRKKMLKAILLLHRYLGFVLSLMFVVWFLSGFVMMYAGYPTMKPDQRLKQLPPVNMEACHLTPQQVLNVAGITDSIVTIRMGMLLARPVYRIVTQQKRHIAIFADNGAVIDKIDVASGSRLARAFVHDASRPQAVDTLWQIDQWMAAYRYQGYLPEVYRFKMNDPAATYVYVSFHTGEVVQMVNARQRFWAWLGPIPHWIYPTILIRNRPVWSQVVIWVSLIGAVMCLTGIIMGIVRYKRKNKQPLVFSPYQKKWFRYHHYTGFVFGIFVFTWILSGWFSMSPVAFGPGPGKQLAERDLLSGGPLNVPAFTLSPRQAVSIFSSFLIVKEIQLIQLDGKPYYLAYQDAQHTRLLAADQERSIPFEYFPDSLFIGKVRAFQPAQQIKESVVLNHYDDYYYSRTFEKRLPVLRVKVDNSEQTWYYFDLKTGQLALRHEKGSRLERWLYHGLHSLDFSFLVYRRPLWDIVVWVLMLGGTAVSITGLVLTWKWLRRKAGKMY